MSYTKKKSLISELKSLRSKKLTRKNSLLTNSQKDINIKLCKLCDKESVIESKGNYVCTKCGIVYDRVIITEESINYNDGSPDPTRTGMVENHLMPSSNKGSVYSAGSTKGGKERHHANLISGMNKRKLNDYKDKNKLNRFNVISSICNGAGINNLIIMGAQEVFSKILDVYSPRGQKLKALNASSVIISHKINHINYNFNVIASIFNIDSKVLRNMLNEYEHYWKEICGKEELVQIKLATDSIKDKDTEQTIELEETYKCDNNIIDTHDNLKHYLEILGIDLIYLEKCEKLRKFIIKKQILIEHVPKSIKACIIFLICKLYDLNKIKKNKIATVCDTSTITINKCFNKLGNHIEDIIDYLNSD